MKLFGFLFKKRCLVCDRPLKSKGSKGLGIGPVCARKNKTLAEQARLEAQGQMKLPLEEGKQDQ